MREQGRRLDVGPFTLWWRPQDVGAATTPRVGVVASTAAIGHAVRRNSAKRRLREVFRRNQAEIPLGIDLLLVARRSLSHLTFREVESKFTEACRRLEETKP